MAVKAAIGFCTPKAVAGITKFSLVAMAVKASVLQAHGKKMTVSAKVIPKTPANYGVLPLPQQLHMVTSHEGGILDTSLYC
jgi:hypothetical protein